MFGLKYARTRLQAVYFKQYISSSIFQAVYFKQYISRQCVLMKILSHAGAKTEENQNAEGF